MTKRKAIEALCNDLLAECRELDAFVSTLPDEDWMKVTAFFDWTVRDEILHLHQVDRFGLVSLGGADDFRALLADVRAKQADGMELSAQVRDEFAGASNAEVLETWRAGYERIAAELLAAPDGFRVTWFGPEMAVLSFATARLMEVWAHGQDIYDLFGHKREPAARVRHICDLGVRTFGWSFRNRGLDVPPRPAIKLTGPGDESWEWSGESDEVITGPALDFAMVVTQRRPVEDTELIASGETSASFLKIAQCFAGAPQERAAPGSRPPL